MKMIDACSKKVLLAMSGGVDSSVAAYLLKKDGFEVTGVTMRQLDRKDDLENAASIAKRLNIRHIIIDVQKVFKREVINRFCHIYRCGHTPNPCILCNRLIKFGILMNLAKKNKAYFATGHYAQIVYNKRKKIFLLMKAKDAMKDQSYVLYMLNKKQLSSLILPLGDRHKEQIKKIAKMLKLPLPKSKESQDICFIPNRDYVEFIVKQKPEFSPRPGQIINCQRQILGMHRGYVFYTIGQRKGLGLANSEPLFVLSIDSKNNSIVVGKETELYAREFYLNGVSFTDTSWKKNKFVAKVKIRYHHQPATAQISVYNKNLWRVEFKRPQKAITPGQAAVFYKGQQVIGGGTITQVDMKNKRL